MWATSPFLLWWLLRYLSKKEKCRKELYFLERLLVYLMKKKRNEDEIVVMLDSSSVTKEVRDYVENKVMSNDKDDIIVISHPLNKDFAAHKNFLNQYCNGDWIFQLDADEIPNVELMAMLPLLIEQNPTVDAYWVSRINTVAGITDEHITKWGWKLTDKGWVNFPDWQMRIYKNSENIYWIKPVHEQLKGYTKFANLPAEEKFALYHPKDIGRQEKQNAFYDTI